jgi:hypothetical protein
MASLNTHVLSRTYESFLTTHTQARQLVLYHCSETVHLSFKHTDSHTTNVSSKERNHLLFISMLLFQFNKSVTGTIRKLYCHSVSVYNLYVNVSLPLPISETCHDHYNGISLIPSIIPLQLVPGLAMLTNTQ